MDPRIEALRACATILETDPSGDREVASLEAGTHASLELIAELVTVRGIPTPRGYKDACDKLAALLRDSPSSRSLCDRLKRVFDVADRGRFAWSSLTHDDMAAARAAAPGALRELAEIAEVELGAGQRPPA